MIVQNFDVRVLLGVDAVASALVGVALTLFVREPRCHDDALGRAVCGDSLRSITGSAITLRLFALYFLAALASGLANPFVPILVRQLHLQQAGLPVILPTVIGVTLTGAGIASAIMTPYWGRLGDIIGRWTVLPICVGAVALALGVEAFAPSLRVFQVAFIGAGFFQGAIGATVLALLATITQEDRRATILNFSLMPFQLALFWANPRRRACLPRVAAAVWRWGVAGLYRLYSGGLARTGRTIRDTIRVSIRRPTRGGKERRFHASGLDRTTPSRVRLCARAEQAVLALAEEEIEKRAENQTNQTTTSQSSFSARVRSSSRIITVDDVPHQRNEDQRQDQAASRQSMLPLPGLLARRTGGMTPPVESYTVGLST